MKKLCTPGLALLCAAMAFTACTETRQSSAAPENEPGAGITSNIPAAPFFGHDGGSIPALMLPDFISSSRPDLNGTFSPDGTEFYYATSYPGLGSVILFTRLVPEGQWSEPEIATFSRKYRNVDPIFSPDGSRLFFTSNRPLDHNSEEEKDMDIWYVEKNGDSWNEAQNLDPTVNTAENQYHSAATFSGNIYYATQDSASNSRDIFVAIKTPAGYRVENLGEGVNSEHLENDPFVSPDEDYLIFTSNRPGGLGGVDLYISYRQGGKWSQAKNLGEPINSAFNDYASTITADNKLLIYTSGRMTESWSNQHKRSLAVLNQKINSADNGLDNIYWVKADFIDAQKNTPDDVIQ